MGGDRSYNHSYSETSCCERPLDGDGTQKKKIADWTKVFKDSANGGKQNKKKAHNHKTKPKVHKKLHGECKTSLWYNMPPSMPGAPPMTAWYPICTSCNTGDWFMMTNYNSRTGSCVPRLKGRPELKFSDIPKSERSCQQFYNDGRDYKDNNPLATNVICTSISYVAMAFRYTTIDGHLRTLVSNNLQDPKGNGNGRFYVTCGTRKETICHESKCSTRSNIMCINVCVYKAWEKFGACNPGICEGESGAQLCRQAGFLT